MWLNVQVEHCSFGLCELIYHRHNCDIDLIRVNLVLFWWKTDFFLSLKGACYCSSQLMYYWSWWIRNCCDALDLIYQIVCYSHHPTQSPWWYSMCAPQIQRVLTMCSILVTFEFSTTKIALLWIKSVVSISLGFFLIQRYNIRKYWHVMMLYFSLKSKECNKSLVFRDAKYFWGVGWVYFLSMSFPICFWLQQTEWYSVFQCTFSISYSVFLNTIHICLHQVSYDRCTQESFFSQFIYLEVELISDMGRDH